MAKSSQAFRTIREVAEWLDVAAHVLRFWESKFPQIKPVKRAGGRRYYRPADMELVGGIKVLLHDRGLTIRGVQKIIREEGVAAVVALSPPLVLDEDAVIEGGPASDWQEDAAPDAVNEAVEQAEEDRQAQLLLDMPPKTELERHPAETVETVEVKEAKAAEGSFDTSLAQLSTRLANAQPLPAEAIERLRPALLALRDRLRADPAA